MALEVSTKMYSRRNGMSQIIRAWLIKKFWYVQQSIENFEEKLLDHTAEKHPMATFWCLGNSGPKIELKQRG